MPVALALVAPAAALGCAQIIGAEGERGLTLEVVTQPEGGGMANFVDASHSVAPVPEAGVTGNGCATGQKKCNNTCVSKTDPIYGCGSSDCTPCSKPNAATTTCINEVCAEGSCKAGFKACSGAIEGCTSDLTEANTCGRCDNACLVAQFCNPDGNCKNGCDPGLTACPSNGSTTCIDTTMSPQHCGLSGDAAACANVCPAGANGDPSCVAGVCALSCRPGYGHCTSQMTCVALTVFYRDGDGDGWGDALATTKLACNAAEAGAGWVSMAGDCHDGDPYVFPGQTKFFGTSYKNPKGAFSYDYDCDGIESENGHVAHYVPCTDACTGAGIAPAGSGRVGAGVNDYCGSTQRLTCTSTVQQAMESYPNLHFSNVTPLGVPVGMLPPNCGASADVVPADPCR